MSYVEIVIQVRSDDASTISDHRHLNIYPILPTDWARLVALRLVDTLTNAKLQFEANNPLKPCCICWQLGKEKPLDPRRSKSAPPR